VNATKAQIGAWLKTHTVGDIPAAKRTAIQNRLTSLGVDVTGITLATPLWDVVVRVFRVHEPFNSLDAM
ncbi:MAG: hypothetical protein OEW08_13840, partial [Gammaproteobacteria bacterium]|nr:hypothetical protein [Gammaproteobacteria bacterium]